MSIRDDIISGLYYIPEYLEDNDLFDQLIKSNDWTRVSNTSKSREVIHYGYKYSYDRSGIKKTSGHHVMYFL